MGERLTVANILYLDWIPSLAPTWLANKWGRRFHEVLGLTFDAFAQAADEGTKAHLLETCPDDALQWIGSERGLEQFPTETPDQYRARLLDAWTQWDLAGTPEAIVAILLAATYVAVVHESRKTFDETRANVWDRPDRNLARWAHAWIEIDQPHPFVSTWTIGDGTLVGTTTCVGFDGDATVIIAALNLIRRQVRKWKSAHVKVDEIIIVLSGRLVGSFTVGDGVIGGVARYVDPTEV